MRCIALVSNISTSALLPTVHPHQIWLVVFFLECYCITLPGNTMLVYSDLSSQSTVARFRPLISAVRLRGSQNDPVWFKKEVQLFIKRLEIFYKIYCKRISSISASAASAHQQHKQQRINSIITSAASAHQLPSAVSAHQQYQLISSISASAA